VTVISSEPRLWPVGARVFIHRLAGAMRRMRPGALTHEATLALRFPHHCAD